MDGILHQASLEGNVDCLIKLLEEDPLVLDRTIATSTSSENPLHIAAMLGHVDFAREILRRKPDLSSEFNSDGFSPLHLASAGKNVEMVRELLKAAPDHVCLDTDNDGRTALHMAAMKGRVETMKELFQCKPEAMDQVLSNRRETILHLCVNHSRVEALKLLLQWVQQREGSRITPNSKDDGGNTILHLAVAKKQIQIIKLLLGDNDNNSNGIEEVGVKKVEVNELNGNGLTALDILAESPVKDVKDMEIAEIIRGAGGLRAKDSPPAHNTVGSSSCGGGALMVADEERRGGIYNQLIRTSSSWKNHLEEHKKWLQEQEKTLMVVASLIASMAFQAMLNPPSGLSTGSKNATGDNDPRENLFLYMLCNTIGFVGSMGVTLLVITGSPFTRHSLFWILRHVMWVASTAIGFSYVAMLEIMERKVAFIGGVSATKLTLIFWSLLTTTCLAVLIIAFLVWLSTLLPSSYGARS